ncbi:unnamed protein product, partial [Rotaria socialis]
MCIQVSETQYHPLRIISFLKVCIYQTNYNFFEIELLREYEKIIKHSTMSSPNLYNDDDDSNNE